MINNLGKTWMDEVVVYFRLIQYITAPDSREGKKILFSSAHIRTGYLQNVKQQAFLASTYMHLQALCFLHEFN
jgi:hypothetical protein